MADCLLLDPSLEPPSKPKKTEISENDRRREDDELQMALALSLQDSSTGGGSSDQQQYTSSLQQPISATTQLGYPEEMEPQEQQQSPTTAATVSRVRALYDFTPSEAGELAFRRGDVILVLDAVYKDWWRGSLRGKTAIFPVNYVEVIPEPTAEEMLIEAQEEQRVLGEGRNVEKLLTLLSDNGIEYQGQGPGLSGSDFNDNEQLQTLYHNTVAIRPKLIKLIEKYSIKKDELISLNEKFLKAKQDYDRLMESSMQRYHRVAPPTQTHLPQQPQRQSSYPPPPQTTIAPQRYPNYPPTQHQQQQQQPLSHIQPNGPTPTSPHLQRLQTEQPVYQPQSYHQHQNPRMDSSQSPGSFYGSSEQPSAAGYVQQAEAGASVDFNPDEYYSSQLLDSQATTSQRPPQMPSHAAPPPPPEVNTGSSMPPYPLHDDYTNLWSNNARQ